jgi:hypothetical protein
VGINVQKIIKDDSNYRLFYDATIKGDYRLEKQTFTAPEVSSNIIDQ